MPWKLKTACRYPGCPNLAEKNGYCNLHSYSQTRTDDKEQAFYRSRDWRETSALYRKLHPICNNCKKAPVAIVHHKVQLYELLRRGEDPCNAKWLEGLCWSCHERTKRQESK